MWFDYLSETEYKHKLAKIKNNNASKERKQLLKAEKDKYKTTKRLPSTSKLLLWMVVFICVEIIGFSEFVMIKFYDTSALYTLIGVPVTLIPTVLGYYYKSAKENTEGGIVYQAFLNENNIENEITEQTDNEIDEDTEIIDNVAG